MLIKNIVLWSASFSVLHPYPAISWAGEVLEGTVHPIRVHSTFPAHILSQNPSDFVSRLAAYFFFGGILMILGAIGEWIVGNTFPTVVFGTFG